MLISGLATGPPAGVGDGLGPFLAASTARFSDFSRQFTAHLFSRWIPSSARDIDGEPRRFTEVVLDFRRPRRAPKGTYYYSAGSKLLTSRPSRQEPGSQA